MDERTEHYIRLIGLKVIPSYFYSINPSEVRKWQFSMCRQTSFIIANILKIKGIECEVWEGNFTSNMVQHYDHSWNYIPGSKTILDVTSTFPYVRSNFVNDPVQALKGVLEFEKIGEYKKCDLDSYFNTTEFFTNKNGLEIMSDIFKIINKSQINF